MREAGACRRPVFGDRRQSLTRPTCSGPPRYCQRRARGCPSTRASNPRSRGFDHSAGMSHAHRTSLGDFEPMARRLARAVGAARALRAARRGRPAGRVGGCRFRSRLGLRQGLSCAGADIEVSRGRTAPREAPVRKSSSAASPLARGTGRATNLTTARIPAPRPCRPPRPWQGPDRKGTPCRRGCRRIA